MLRLSKGGLRAAMLSAVLMAAPLAAHATTVVFSGTAASGADPLGQTYATTLGDGGDTDGTPNAFGIPTWGEDANVNGGVLNVFKGAPGLTQANQFVFTYTGAQSLKFLTDYDIGFGVWQSDAHPGGDSLTSISGNTVTFTAPEGMELNVGENFDFIVGFNKAIDPSKFSFTAEWIGTDASAAVPEPTTWALLIAGFGAIGGMLRARRRGAANAAA